MKERTFRAGFWWVKAAQRSQEDERHEERSGLVRNISCWFLSVEVSSHDSTAPTQHSNSSNEERETWKLWAANWAESWWWPRSWFSIVRLWWMTPTTNKQASKLLCHTDILWKENLLQARSCRDGEMPEKGRSAAWRPTFGAPPCSHRDLLLCGVSCTKVDIISLQLHRRTEPFLVAMVMLGWWFDSMILEIFTNLDDSVILWCLSAFAMYLGLNFSGSNQQLFSQSRSYTKSKS